MCVPGALRLLFSVMSGEPGWGFKAVLQNKHIVFRGCAEGCLSILSVIPCKNEENSRLSERVGRKVK